MNRQDKKAWKQKLAESVQLQSLWKWISIHKEISILGALLLILAVAVIAVKGGSSNDTTESAKETITIIGNRTTAQETEMNPEEPLQAIETLISRYFSALAACDIDTLNSICETTEPFDEAKLAEHATYIESYRNLDCTIMNGLVEGTYVVYVYYELKFHYIDTTAPALVQLYIKTDKDQMPYIYQGVIDGELSAYIAELTAGDQISRLVEEVNQKLQIACASDPDLDTFIRVLQNQTPEAAAETEAQAGVYHHTETNSL